MEIDGKQKALAIASHISYLFFGVGTIIVPLVIYLYFDKKDDFVAGHAKQALVIQVINAVIWAIIGALTMIAIGVFLWPIGLVVGLVWFVCSLIGAWRALQGESYHYPLLDRF